MSAGSNFSIDPSYHSSSAAGYDAAKHGSAHSGAEHSGHHGAYNSHAGHQKNQYGQHSKEHYGQSDYQVKHLSSLVLLGCNCFMDLNNTKRVWW